MADSGDSEYESNRCREYEWVIIRNTVHAPPPNQRRVITDILEYMHIEHSDRAA